MLHGLKKETAMKLSLALIAVPLALGAGYVRADTTSSGQDKATMERKASPSNDTKQDEEQAEAHGQPDSQTSSGSQASDNDSSSSSGSSSSEDQSNAAQTQKPTSGDYYQSNENKADSTKSQQ
jgi:hypothetical protein